MWFYLYLITTAIHFQHGWTIINITQDMNQTEAYYNDTYPNKHGWTITNAYQFDMNYISILYMVTKAKSSYQDNETMLEWYRDVPFTHIEYVCEAFVFHIKK